MSTAKTLRIVVGDDHAIVRSGLRTLLHREPDMEVVGEASSSEETLACAATHVPDLVLIDLYMPGSDTLDAIGHLHRSEPRPYVIVFTGYDDRMDASLCFRAGADGFLAKHAPPQEVIAAIRTVASGKRYIDPCFDEPVSSDLAREASLDGQQLSSRESQVLGLTARGYGSKEIADILDLSVRTVETYRDRVSKKLGLRSRGEFSRYAHHSGLHARVPTAAKKAR